MGVCVCACAHVKIEELRGYLFVDGKDPAGEQNLMMQETWGHGLGYPGERNAFREEHGRSLLLPTFYYER